MTSVYEDNLIPDSTVLNLSLNSKPVSTNLTLGYAIQAVITGTPNGTFSLEASTDVVPSPFTAAGAQPINWNPIADSSQSATAAGNYYYNVSQVEGFWVRLVYTDLSSGTSTATITKSQINLKGP